MDEPKRLTQRTNTMPDNHFTACPNCDGKGKEYSWHVDGGRYRECLPCRGTGRVLVNHAELLIKSTGKG